MKLTKLAAALALAMAAGSAQVAFAGGPDERPLWEMLIKSAMNRQGMVAKADFMKFMEKRFDAMDKKGTGMLTPEQIRVLVGDGQP